jgi:predicted NUDIX family phosphoesterase
VSLAVSTPVSEQVLVVPRSCVLGQGPWNGLRPGESDGLLEAIVREARYEARAAVETDQRWKQLIPYLILRDGPRYFLMRRTRAGTDARLHDLWSIGVGGHINPGDGGVVGGLEREWREEIDAGFALEPRFLGLLNDDSTPVGRVHVGLVFATDAAGLPVAIRETDKLQGAFASPEEVRAVRGSLESWSRLVFEHLDSPAGRAVGL